MLFAIGFSSLNFQSRCSYYISMYFPIKKNQIEKIEKMSSKCSDFIEICDWTRIFFYQFILLTKNLVFFYYLQLLCLSRMYMYMYVYFSLCLYKHIIIILIFVFLFFCFCSQKKNIQQFSANIFAELHLCQRFVFVNFPFSAFRFAH